MDLSIKAAEARREYHRQWAKANRDKIKANNARYWAKKAAQAAQAAQPPEGRREAGQDD